jgi:hypothetical protein
MKSPVKPLLLAFAAAATFLGGPAAQAQQWRGIQLDPQGLIRPQLLSLALKAYEQHAQTKPVQKKLAIVDFSKPSSERRMFLVDLTSGLVSAFLVAHGRGSDADHDSLADRFSDEMGSHASSLGAYLVSEPYQGSHGLSIRLDGLDSTNRSARDRAVVLHSQWYVSDKLAASGKVGRSFGCFVVDRAVIKQITQQLANGGFLFASR